MKVLFFSIVLLIVLTREKNTWVYPPLIMHISLDILRFVTSQIFSNQRETDMSKIAKPLRYVGPQWNIFHKFWLKKFESSQIFYGFLLIFVDFKFFQKVTVFRKNLIEQFLWKIRNFRKI